MRRAVVSIFTGLFHFVQVFLVVVFRIIPLRCALDLGGDRLALVPLVSDLLFDLLRDLQLLVVFGEDGRPVLRAGVGALSVQRRRVVHLEEELNQLSIGHSVRVKDDQ